MAEKTVVIVAQASSMKTAKALENKIGRLWLRCFAPPAKLASVSILVWDGKDAPDMLSLWADVVIFICDSLPQLKDVTPRAEALQSRFPTLRVVIITNGLPKNKVLLVDRNWTGTPGFLRSLIANAQ